MSRFVLEALFIGVKEGLKLSLCAVLASSYLRSAGLEHLRRPLVAGLTAVFLASFGVMTVDVSVELRETIVKLIGYVFGLFYFFSLGALFHETGTDLLGPLAGAVRARTVLASLTVLLTVLYFVPDMAGSSLYVSDLAFMSGRRASIMAAAGAGFGLSLAGAYGTVRALRPDLSRMYGLPQLLLSLALIKLLAGGVRGFAELSLIPAVQAGLMKLVHDVVHQGFVFAMVPDHPIISTTAWNFVGFLFRETAGLWLSLVLLVLPLALFIVKHFSAPAAVPAEVTASARKRLFLKALRDERVLKSLPVTAFLLCIISVWFVQKGEGTAGLYNPDPRPVIAEDGVVTIPLQSPLADLRNGKIHKFSLTAGDEVMRLLIMKKPDGLVTVCLDACEICAPDGYGQAKEHVVCLYCNTPIPFETVGKPGGCNPIPIPARITDKDVRIEVAAIAQQWAVMKSGQAKGGGEK